jgi:acyl-[acyl carrier protein]--UDP-N-acetylglucosamine O-acyltransferase
MDVYIAHGCSVDDRIIIANVSMMGGNAEIGKDYFVG